MVHLKKNPKTEQNKKVPLYSVSSVVVMQEIMAHTLQVSYDEARSIEP